jgi:HlyD family secretion protein
LRAKLLLIATVLPVLFLVTGCSKKEKEVEPVVSVQAVPVQRGPMELVVQSQAVIFPIQQAAITPKISAPVERFYVGRGARVHKGQLLVTLQNGDLRGALEQAQANYKSTTQASLPEDIQKAQLDVTAAKQTLDAAQKVYDSREELFKQGALPRRQLDEARVALVQAQNQYAMAQRHLESMQAVNRHTTTQSVAGQLETARSNVAFTEIRSPIDGVVTDRPAYAGETPASGVAIITVMDISRVTARVHLPQEQAALLKVGDPAEILPPGSDTAVAAKITLVNPATDPNSTTVEVWAEAPNADGRLRPGTTAQLSIVARKVPDALIVPAAAILNTDDGAAVMTVIKDNKDPKEPVDRAKKQPVTAGIQQGDKVQITSGLQAGQQVITVGAYGLPDNTKVKIEQPAAPGKAPESDEKDEKKGGG